MPYFNVKGIGKETSRKRSKRYKAQNSESAKILAEDNGTIVEFIVQEVPGLATDNQINYANDLGLKFVENITINEMSHLISKGVDKDTDSPMWLQQYALKFFPEENGLAITKYIGLKGLLNYIIHRFAESSDPSSLIELFIYSIINDSTGSNWNVSFGQLAEEIIINSLADELSKEKNIVDSIKRYSGRDIISFGEYTDNKGYLCSGGSKRTSAYERTKNRLVELGIIKKTEFKQAKVNQSQGDNSVTKDKSGCFGSILFLTISVLSIIAFVLP